MRDPKYGLGQSLRIILALGWSDFVLKYRGSFFGYLWSLVGPLVKFGVILYVFGPFVEQAIPMYPLYLFLGIILWEHFSLTTSGCMNMLHEKQSIIQRMVFPRILLVFAVGWTNIIILSTHFTIFLFAAWMMGVPPTVHLLYVPIILLQFTLLTMGIGMLLTSWSLKYRDIPHLWGVLTSILFWLTPIMYPYELTGGSLNRAALAVSSISVGSLESLVSTFIHIQPLSIIIHDTRRVTLYSSLAGTPTFAHGLGLTLVCFVVFLLGTLVFQHRSPSFLEEY